MPRHRVPLAPLVFLAALTVVTMGVRSYDRMQREMIDNLLRINGFRVAGAIESFDPGNEIYPSGAESVRWELRGREPRFPQNPITHDDLVVCDADSLGAVHDHDACAGSMAGNIGYYKGSGKAYVVFVYGRDQNILATLGRRENGNSFPKDDGLSQK